MSLITTDIGDVIIVRGTLTDEAGDPVVGATVTARALTPAGVEQDLGDADDEGAGVYSVTLEPTTAGRWQVRFDSASPAQAAAEGIVHVRESRFS
jgi:hypothetical protein